MPEQIDWLGESVLVLEVHRFAAGLDVFLGWKLTQVCSGVTAGQKLQIDAAKKAGMWQHRSRQACHFRVFLLAKGTVGSVVHSSPCHCYWRKIIEWCVNYFGRNPSKRAGGMTMPSRGTGVPCVPALISMPHGLCWLQVCARWCW